MQKIIVIQDDNAHILTYEYSLDNLKKTIAYVLEYDQNVNTVLYGDEEILEGRNILSNPNVTVQELEEWILEYGPCGRCSGNMLNITNLIDEMDLSI